MRKHLLFAFISIITIFITSGFGQYSETVNFLNSSANKNLKKPVLVELFTSASCAACPPAEALLMKLETGQPFDNAELITLEFHVDYRDGFGQKDAYASPLFTQRQQVYDRKFQTGKIYTPQMVVDGDIEFVGSKFDRAERAVDKSVQNKKASIKLSYENERLSVKISDIPDQDASTIYLAITEDGISTRGNKDLSNVSVVRRLKGLGRIEANQKTFEMITNFPTDEDWKRENLKFVLFIQENKSRKILGVEQIK
ncbi:MAG: DUF1223 domain-containing protein [Acidobacteriota bacterium]|nr:DUF1223 domain-containing protein [Acidobacteriota bacterium]